MKINENKMTKEPAYRFSGYTDAWEQRKLGEYFIERKERSDKGELISVTINEGIKKFSDLERKDNSSQDKSNYKVVKQGDIAYNSMRMWQGASGLSPYDGIVSPAYTVITPTSWSNSKFFSYNFKREELINQFQANSQGLTSDTWNLKFTPFSQIKTLAPSLSEQTAIGDFFQTLDRSIALHQRKLDSLKEQKKTYLQKLFPRNGKTIPEIRFPEFQNAPAWEQLKLGEVAEMNPKSNLPDEFEYVDLESVIGTELISHRHEFKETAPSRAQRLAVKGDVFYQTVRPYQRNNYLFNLTATDFVFSTGYAQLRPINTHSYFLLTYLQTSKFVNQVLDNCTGTSYPAINSSDLSKLKVTFPTLSEQTAIGTFFQTLDRSIALHQRKLDKLKESKQTLLKKMFI